MDRLRKKGETYYDESSHSVAFDYANAPAAGGEGKFYEAQLHEFRHMVQFENGEAQLSLDGKGGDPDVIDELDALNYGVSHSTIGVALYSLEIGSSGAVIPVGPDDRLSFYITDGLLLGIPIIDANSEIIGYRSINVVDSFDNDPSLSRSVLLIGRFSWKLSNPLTPSTARPKASVPLSNPIAPNP